MMYLKRLESVGFKSFAERIHIAFVPGVTAVVGPNGSGKSNITDAIRWVLGEQSVKSLRGAKMEDIIFQGSDTRNPLNFAEVTLILDNNSQLLPLDYEEVSVTRRVYRSGVSEFYLNKQSCRLKDIIDLFMDSGLGQESFSIISQGRVEEVLSSKAEERRAIFEEAAGVLKYKQRKRRATYKLMETRENLKRVDDIIYEIEQQINPLKKQSKIAENYLMQMESLKQHEISLLITEIENLHKEWKELLTCLDEKKMNELQFKTKIHQKEAQIEVKRNNLQKTDEKIESLQTKLLEMTQQAEQLEGKKQVLNERMKHFSRDKEKLITQKENAKEQLENIQKTLQNDEITYNELEKNKDKIEQEILKLNNKLTVDQNQLLAEIEEYKSEYIEYLNKQAASRNEIQSIRQQLEQLERRRNSQTEKMKNLSSEAESIETKKTDLWNAYMEKKQEYLAGEESVKTLKRKLNEKREHFNCAQEKLYKGRQTITKLASRKEILEEMKESFQGFFYGVKAVLQAKQRGQLAGIHGAVIECIDVPKQYIMAIETVLGGQAQHIIVKNDHAAREAIAWLRHTNKGRATFLPLTTIQPRVLTPDLMKKIENQAGFIGIAARLVHTSDKYMKTVDYLLGNVLVAKTLKTANEIAKLTAHRYRIVTIEGDIITPGGAMTGGTNKNLKQSLFTRDTELQDLTEKLSRFRHKAKVFEQEILEQEQTIEQIIQELEKQEQLLGVKQQGLHKKHEAYKACEMTQTSLHDTFTFYRQNQQQFEHECQRLKENDMRLQADLTTIQQSLQTIQNKIDYLTKQEKELRESQIQYQSDIHGYQISLAEQEERIRNQSEKVKTIKKQLIEVNNQYEGYSHDLAKLVHSQETETTAVMEEEIQAKRRHITELTKLVQEKRTTRLKLTRGLQDGELELKEDQKKYYTLIEDIQQLEVKAARLDTDLENRLASLQADYTITFERASQSYERTSNIDETKKCVNQLKERIKALGTVNLGSIDEYKRIFERHEFLETQKTDLIDAKQTLYSIISEMDHVMKERFEKTFLQIKREFTIVFKELFGGGHASLTLTEPENILDTGIEIVAQPPGKRLQNLGLLSGGERALTAISLLFSILRVRPVPFCVLDEVEAALDEANVIRFAKYVKLHSKDTQFIVITHRKGTMEEADVLYGITMQESGVSRLVSVQLEDTNELVNT